MFDWFRRKEEQPMEFPDNAAAFAHACSVGYALLINARIPALVMEEGKRGRDGERWFRLNLATQENGREIWAPVLADAPGSPQVGDLVAFRIVRIATELPEHASLVGYVDSRLEPVLNGSKGWRIAASFRPDSLKPELHVG